MSVASTPGAWTPGNPYHPNGRTLPSPFLPQPPLPPPPGAHRPDTLIPDESCSLDDQIDRLAIRFKGKETKIGVFYPSGGNRTQADAIAKHLNILLSGGKTTMKVYEMRRDGQHWLAIATGEMVSHYVFLDLPPVRIRGPLFSRQNSIAQEAEEDFFSPHGGNHGNRITEVVFIGSPAAAGSTQGRKGSLPKQMKGFLCLSGDLDSEDLAKRVLGHFAASQPCPFEIDNAYWSLMPKLISVQKNKSSLGITLVTREMSPKSAFPRIALIKALNEDCVSELRSKVGRYTHIQSINGQFLDGLDIKDISSIFQSETKGDCVQLMVRFIHSKQGTRSPVNLIPAGKLDPSREDLPTPVYILSDNNKMANLLFKSLTTDQGPRGSFSSLHTPTHPRRGQNSVVSEASAVTDPKFYVEPDSAVSTPGENGDGLKGRDPNKLWFPIDSDKSMNRASISSSLADAEYSPTTPGSKPVYNRTPSLMKQNIASKHYIPQMFCNDFERRFAHIFLRSSGLFLVTAWFKDLADDPLIQYENLSYWLRLIQSRTDCADEKRVIIVGMYDGKEQEDLAQIQEYVCHLNKALHESDLHKQIFDQNRNKRLRGNTGKQVYVFMFDVSRPADSCHDLYARMEECMDLFTEKKLHFDPQSFDSMFKAFDGLNVALRELSAKPGIVGLSEDLKALCNRKPPYALKTLEAYSTALVDSTMQDAILKPCFLLDLLAKLGTTGDRSIYDVFTVSAKALKNLPVVSAPWPLYVMGEIATTLTDFPLNDSSKKVILSWAERLGLIFKLESDRPKKEDYYFVPSLAAQVMGDAIKYHWDENEERFYKSPEATVLFAYLHFPANHQFFDRVVAELLKDGFTKGMKLFINIGCTEAILPLSLIDTQGTLSVLLIYHPLQNVIEFRTRQRAQRSPVNLSFLKAVKDKLYRAYSTSSYDKHFNFDNAISYHVPSPDYDPRLTSSALWKLWQLELIQAQQEGLDEEDVEVKLLKTNELTPDKLTTWGAYHPEMKNIPGELFMRWSRLLSTSDNHWSMVGAKLKLLTTVDINILRTTPHPGGNGEVVLRKWCESDLSYKELVAVLCSQEVRLNVLAKEIEEYFSGSDV